MLLGLEAVHVDWQFRRRDDIRQENKFPIGELRTVTQVEILGERVVLPPARFIDARPAPEPGGAVEIKEPSAAAARGLFQQKMAIEEHRLDACQQGIAAVQMTPARLDHPYFRIREEMDRLLQQVRVRDEIRVQDADELAVRGSQPGLESAGLEAGPIRPVDQLDVESAALH